MIDPEKPVRVFRNLKHGCYSIMQGGRLCATARQVRLAGVELRVRESGRQRMLRLGRKTLHAYALGHLVDWVHPSDPRDLDPLPGPRLDYDPFRGGHFFDVATGAPVLAAASARFGERGVTYRPAGEDVGDPPLPFAA